MRIYVFTAIGGTAYVTANKSKFNEKPDAYFMSVSKAIQAVQDSGLMLQLDRALLDENKGAGGYSFAGDDFNTYTVEL